MSLIGTLGDIKLADVLRLFALGRKSGVLTVAGGAQNALMRFQKGAIVHASSGRLQGDEAVVVRGVETLRDGQRLRIKR